MTYHSKKRISRNSKLDDPEEEKRIVFFIRNDIKQKLKAILAIRGESLQLWGEKIVLETLKTAKKEQDILRKSGRI